MALGGNKNKILWDVEGGNGIKTGYTKAAGRCLASAAERAEMQVVCITLNCPDMFEDSAVLLNNAFKEFVIMRNKIKKPLATKQALTRMMNKIDKLSGGDNDLAIKILNQSTDHCWQDVYELKTDNGGNRTNNGGIDWDNV